MTRDQRVKRGRKETNLEAMVISRQEMIVTWIRVKAQETVGNVLILDLFRGRITWIWYQIRYRGEKKGEIEDNFRDFDLIVQVSLSPP